MSDLSVASPTDLRVELGRRFVRGECVTRTNVIYREVEVGTDETGGSCWSCLHRAGRAAAAAPRRSHGPLLGTR